MQNHVERMMTVVKLDNQGQEKLRYTGLWHKELPHGLVIQARWTLPTNDLGYTRFEPGDLFVEYYYDDRWFNVLMISSNDGVLKGWYCNMAEPAHIDGDSIEMLDLLLDVWVDASGKVLMLDEDEFAAANLSERQREGARQGLAHLLQIVEGRQEMFAGLQA
jgi:predicted RNA-binding protein associated with RNAse of E/G family